ncbi:iron-containing alcohol dehydrogenase [Sphaerochaeta sp.]|jgi:alcohol dehydrogenase|uniref:iron-containing alcohol dehydrogenase n=1 Tax=Sphaerochaeta sp. TaxID=1972642 RepID=UPI00258BC1DC|nr:iron-containing alcohol dehydrogenase [Sphaerochaeta sp.]MDD3424709.1 iron-containing alcohol dehydrogenase [Sphaerochaeta sp.]MDD3456573.1 iron-containing alcohol dehydrogenase [Sphaerochaeta sp.]
MDQMKRAYELLKEWKGDSYVHGLGVLDQVGPLAAAFGKRALVVSNTTYMKPVADRVVSYLQGSGVELAGNVIAPDAKPNAPREDVYRLESYILHTKPDSIVVIGGGSAIDAVKAANALAALGAKVTPEIDHYFGTNVVTDALAKTNTTLIPVIAVQTSASSGAHLTKYSNITDPVVGQKKLIVDNALVPTVGLFDYETTVSMPISVTIDGALDAIAHTFEVFCGAKEATYEKAKQIAECAISLVAEYAKVLVDDPKNVKAREAIGLATDLGGYAIMIGGTSGAHLTSFSLVDIVSHGTACGIMNPYYAVLYSKAIQKQLKVVGSIFSSFGFGSSVENLEGRELALAVADAMIAFSKSIKAPSKLSDLKGFTDAHIERALSAAKDPQLEMKLKNMPVPMTSGDVDVYMGPLLRAAASGDLSLIKEM